KGRLDAVKIYTQALKLELANTRMATEAMGKLLLEEQKRTKDLRAIEKQEEQYREDLARNKLLFDAITKRVDEVSILKDFAGGFEAETIAPAEAGVRVAPKPVLVFSIAVLLGLLGGFVLAYTAELADQSFRSPEEI